ncbi:uncharacterized protein LOC6730287 [Drosophila simulans]|uniref:uncharacterized protein LOC6730287 n=1 Tax=Drosophila simulans TaxID=7240 RepID=UPI00078AEA37|nr:uncharacterized protein LOC6730287 [Drosophila simulans]KMZ06945.1 uncharacterized protein Dsimw501_GD21553 [Drosophila simulans]
MENQKDLVTQRTWRRILEHLTPVKGYKAAERKVSWYRGLSQSQMAAANALFDILRENMDKNTTSNVAKLMVKLGLHPYPPWKTLHMVIKLSRGNDLAFLWFLMEMCYKTPNHGETYSVNEQIIMTAIFRLDLFPTLRELDRWLPLPHSSQSDRDKADALRQRNQRLKKEKEDERQRDLARKAKIVRPLSPYFQEPYIPGRIRNERKLLSDYPDTAATLFHMDEEPLEAYLWSRWFGTYTLNDAHRVGKSIIFEEINNIFKSFKAASLPTRDVESLCAHHQYIREMEKSLKDKLEMMKRRKCVELIEAKNRLEERKRKRVIQELEEMSACYLKRFQEMAARARLASTSKTLFGGSSVKATYFGCPDNEIRCDAFDEERCQTFEAERVTENHISDRPKSGSGGDIRLTSGAQAKTKTKSRSRSRSRSKSRRSRKPQSKARSTKEPEVGVEAPVLPPRMAKEDFRDITIRLLKGENPILQGCPDFHLEPPHCAKCLIFDPQKGLPQKPPKKHRPSSLMQFLQNCASEGNEEEDSHHEMAAIPSAHSVQEPKLFDLGLLGRNCARFNYRELFGSLQRTQLDDERMRLKEAFVRAIDDDVQYLSAALSGEEEGSLDALVDQAAKRVFAQDVKAFHEELKKMNKQKAAKEYNPDSRLNFGQEFYDPENIPLMKEMLRLGLEKVAQDKRYVLPTLPDVHSVPYLIEWIRLRYGKRYSYGEKKQILNRDKLVMDQITWMMHTNLEKIPTLPVGDNFTDLAKLRGLTKKLRERYTNKFLEAIMEVERVFYSAMKPHLCNLATEETFLAYLPAHFHDLGFTVNTVS